MRSMNAQELISDLADYFREWTDGDTIIEYVETFFNGVSIKTDEGRRFSIMVSEDLN